MIAAALAMTLPAGAPAESQPELAWPGYPHVAQTDHLAQACRTAKLLSSAHA